MKRTPYMQLVINHTYSQVPIIAIQQGKLAGAWEKAIAKQLEKDHNDGRSLPIQTLQLLGVWESSKPLTPEIWLQAAYLIRSTPPLETILKTS